MNDNTRLFGADALTDFARAAFIASGMAHPISSTVAATLVRGDLMGHDTHGLALLPAYLASASSGGMTLDGTPKILNAKPATELWDGKMLPGPWLITEGFKKAVQKAEEFGSFSLSIRNSHHTASLVSYLKPVVDRGMIAILTVSDPTEACVAPFGACSPVLSTNPIAFAYPAEGGAVMVDMSSSEATNGMVNRLYSENRLFDDDKLIDPQGKPSRDPAIRYAEIPGAIMPLGGASSGYKGTGLGMTVEALSHGLSGNGRSAEPTGWINNVFLQVIDPDGFAGQSRFAVETGFLGMAIRQAIPADPARLPRVPGERAQKLLIERSKHGVPLSLSILAGLSEWSDKYGIPMPEEL